MHIIGGKHKKRTLHVPHSQDVRPTSSLLRESLFNICQMQIEGARFLDLFAGSGAMGLEAISRGAKQATFVDKNKASLVAMKKNIELMHEEGATRLLFMDALKGLEKLSDEGARFDIIYADPPYNMGFSLKILDFLDSHPLLAEGGVLFIEDAAFENPPLKSLIWKKDRKFGRALLREYDRVDSGDI